MYIYYQKYISTRPPPPALSPRAPACAPSRDSKVNSMKMTVRIIVFCGLALALANSKDPARIGKQAEIKNQLDVVGKEPITVMETDGRHWQEYSRDFQDQKDDVELKNTMTDIIHDTDGNPRCFGPSCQEGFTDGDWPHKDFDEHYPDNVEKLKDYPEFSKDRLQAISALAAKLKKEKYKSDHYVPLDQSQSDEDDNGKVFTSWNRLKVKQHKHPYDDKEGWVTLEPVAWSTSKISKWKPNVKKQKPYQWNDDSEKPDYDDRYSSYQGIDSYPQQNHQKRPNFNRPTFINNKLHMSSSSSEYDSEMPSKPTWNKPQQGPYSYPTSWSPDEGRRPHKPNCESEEHFPNNSGAADDTVFYGISDSVITDHRPTKFPFEYEALHQAPHQKRPIRRPTQVIYAGTPELDSDRASRPPYGDGQWVLLSTTKGYRNKKWQRSLNPTADDRSDGTTMTSHQAVALTVLPIDNAHTNMTTSHGGLLEVEKTFQTVEESKRDMDKKYDLAYASSQQKPAVNRAMKRRIVSNVSPDSSTVLAAVGAGMLPATMAMVVPMMLGRRRRRDLNTTPKDLNFNNFIHKYQ
ncbi:hypothetical protein MSG28_004597 [Choristoneura fumiferana]|uniref:Uncharacterized protein n=1 Tax=Choristoneura fumiferana TaxID=7141 RepID=A0ACC0K761_CHOFU|nr:hypothetical protein MSG28_004597 [Choristoneura fumiferana]